MKRQLKNNDDKEDEEEGNDIPLVKLGKLKAIKVEDSGHYHALYDEMKREFDYENTGEGLYQNRDDLLDAFKEGRLFTLIMLQNDKMVSIVKEYRKFPSFCLKYGSKWGNWTLPSLCILHRERKDTITIIWTSKKARSMGFATALLESLKIRYALDVLEGNETFFKNRNIEVIRELKPPLNLIIEKERKVEEESSVLDSLESSSEEEDDEGDGWIIQYKHISPGFWGCIYDKMSDKRIETQLFKLNIFEGKYSSLMAHTLFYGQCLEKENTKEENDYITRNKVMLISRPFLDHIKNPSLLIEECKGEVQKFGLFMHNEEITFHKKKAFLLVIMDSGINKENALSFAKKLDCENTQ